MVRVLAISLVVLAVTFYARMAVAQVPASIKASESLNQAADQFKVKISSQSYSAVQIGDRVFEGAVIDGFEKIPVTSYGGGVDYAIVRYSSSQVKDGYYKARVVPAAPITRVGNVKVSVHLIDASGKIVHTNDSKVAVFSLVLPRETRKHSPALEFSSSVSRPKAKMSIGAFSDIEVMGTVCCPNGMCGICIGRACPKN